MAKLLSWVGSSPVWVQHIAASFRLESLTKMRGDLDLILRRHQKKTRLYRPAHFCLGVQRYIFL